MAAENLAVIADDNFPPRAVGRFASVGSRWNRGGTMRPPLMKSERRAPARSAGAITPAPSVGSALPTRILRVGEVMVRTGLSRTTLWRLERRGLFPAKRYLSAGAVGWIEAEVEDWIV